MAAAMASSSEGLPKGRGGVRQLIASLQAAEDAPPERSRSPGARRRFGIRQLLAGAPASGAAASSGSAPAHVASPELRGLLRELSGRNQVSAQTSAPCGRALRGGLRER